MDLEDSQVTRIATRYLDDSLRSLLPDAAPIPFMVAGGPHGIRHVELHSLTDPDFPETAQTVIPAFIVLDEAFDMALAAFITNPDICAGAPECGFIAHWSPRGRDLFVAKVMRRNNQPPVLGEWLKGLASIDLGPIDDGVRRGIHCPTLLKYGFGVSELAKLLSLRLMVGKLRTRG